MKKTKRKWIWFDAWDIEEFESWLTDMAENGWKLIRLNHWIATFEQCEPRQLQYRCEIKSKNQADNERIDFYEEFSWDYIGSRQLIDVFQCEGEVTLKEELHTDAAEFSDALSNLKREIYWRALTAVGLTLALFWITWSSLTLSSTSHFLDNTSTQLGWMLLPYYLILCWTMVRGMVHISFLVKKLKKGQMLNHRVNYRRRLHINRGVVGAVIVLTVVYFSFSMSELLETLGENQHPKIPENVSVLSLHDVLGDTFIQSGNGNHDNHYTLESSLLAPAQVELYQGGEVPGMEWEDGSGPYTPTIRSFGYKLRTEWLAERFVTAMLEDSFSSLSNYSFETDLDFDEIWVSQTDSASFTFVARIDQVVFQVYYFGMEPLEEVLALSVEKMRGFLDEE
ncbi:DUF2812 domain-containing protein [Bacillus suaedae]|uniref:DUF2812 domain-containing protein n=1 Tax=Halalkalibacter suaedae TaxID=2822140 RepID=A0A940WWN6_9BACI|nr:DUF2812 domain-containing protein [Bacillus suaedae]MBP3951892.1 DUF2812 domain-containing protein [Bacillus suaedae]